MIQSKDAQFFNCSEDHEREYVAKLYEDSEKVEATLKEWCKAKKLNYTKRVDLYDMLEKAGFKRKK